MKVQEQYVDERMALYHGDSCEILREIPSNSVHFEVYSPPFASLYTYSNSERDLGNTRNDGEFFQQFEYIVEIDERSLHESSHEQGKRRVHWNQGL